MANYDICKANDCMSAVINILDMNCVNPNRFCATCKETKKCHLAVKIAHDALCGVCGLGDDVQSTKWFALRNWKQEYDARKEDGVRFMNLPRTL